MKQLLIAVSLVLLAGLAGPSVPAVDCPPEYSACGPVPGKSCKLETGAACDVTALDPPVNTCVRPGPDFECDDCQAVATRECDCITRLQLECCLEQECGDPEVCGICESQAGAQTLTCIGIPSTG